MKPRYKLEDMPGKKKYHCPGCGKKTLTRYVDTLTGELLPDQYGRCDREINCDPYHLSPYHDGYAKQAGRELNNQSFFNSSFPTGTRARAKQPKPQPSFIDPEIMKQGFNSYDKNNFVLWLIELLGSETASQLIGMYNIGTSKYQFRKPDFPGYISPPGSCVFWQVDRAGKVRAGKIMLYNVLNGRRVKEPFSHVTWVHSALKLEGFNLQQVYFGEHLLKLNPSAKVGVVESEKSAICVAAFLPDFVWLACGGFKNLKPELCECLAGRTVYLFPDLKGFEGWKEKAAELNATIPGAAFYVSDLLENNATDEDRANGADIADFLVRMDYQEFRKSHEPGTVKYGEIRNPHLAKLSIQNVSESKVDINRYSKDSKTEHNKTPEGSKVEENRPANDTIIVLNSLPEGQAKIARNSTDEDFNPVKKVDFLEVNTRTEVDFFGEHLTKPHFVNFTTLVDTWAAEVDELQNYFTASRATGGLVIDQATTIKDFLLFINSHLAVIRANDGNPRYLPYLNRLKQAKEILLSQ